MKTNCCLPLAALACLLVAGTDIVLAVRDPGPAKKKPPQVIIKGLPDPGNLTAYQNQVGKVLYFEVTGQTTGPLWGTVVYTNDSQLSKAAVHAGVLPVGQKGIVKVTILAGQAAYQGTTSNGVTSSGYGPWSGSYRVEALGKK